MQSKDRRPLFHSNCENDPHLLDRATAAAKRLAASVGMPPDYWEDYRQELLLETLRRSAKFDPGRGSWEGFVAGVFRHRAAELARGESRRRREFSSLDPSRIKVDPSGRAGQRERLNTKVDVRKAIDALPHHLAPLARLLMESTPTEAAILTRKSRSRIYQVIGEIRVTFEQRGFRRHSFRSRTAER